MREVSRGQIKSHACNLAGVVNDSNVTDGWLSELVNLHMPALYDFLILAGVGDYYSETTTITTSPGVIQNGLPVSFHSVTAVYALVGEQRIPIDPVTDRRRAAYRAPTGAYPVEVEYLPSCPVLDDDGDTFDGVNGWDELVSAKVARDIMLKRQADPSAVMAIIASSETLIRSHASPRDRGGPRYIEDVESSFAYPFSGTQNPIRAYRLRGQNLELYESQLCWWA